MSSTCKAFFPKSASNGFSDFSFLCYPGKIINLLSRKEKGMKDGLHIKICSVMLKNIKIKVLDL